MDHKRPNYACTEQRLNVYHRVGQSVADNFIDSRVPLVGSLAKYSDVAAFDVDLSGGGGHPSKAKGLTIELQRVEQGHTWVERQPWAPLSKWPQVTLMRAFYWKTQQRCRAFDQHPSS